MGAVCVEDLPSHLHAELVEGSGAVKIHVGYGSRGYANRQCSHRFHPPNRHLSAFPPSVACAELVSTTLDPLLPVESVAHSEPSSIEAVAVLIHQSSSFLPSFGTSGPSIGPCLLDGELLLLTASVTCESVPPKSLSPLAPVFVPISPPPFSLPFDGLFPPKLMPPRRPNTDPRINGLPPRSSHPTRVTSRLHRDAWAYFL
ncbi:hypothetical protein F5050DRAFT_1812529 [Lentinula boryana]|uniref:Uncharacterized protein n=1 Tax=Lentinula boryana TaxID=40481 RepID=A0ABQ8Q0T1_9AGAR|nr:hypothetical protein F5050DRAFT_1812529 [Lentinula boryana]